MKFYLYCSSGTLLEYFSINKIVANEYLNKRNRKVIHSLGLIGEKFIFVTPKKLSFSKRKYGLEQCSNELPAIIEISISDNDAKVTPVFTLSKEGILSEDFCMLSEISDNIDGVFIAGEISFSYVTRIIFNAENAKDVIYRPSKDLFFPETLYDVVDKSFEENANIQNIINSSKKLDILFSKKDFASIVSKRNKMTAIILNIILETKEWPFGKKYKANFDDVTIKILGLSNKIDEITNNKYSELKTMEQKDEILCEDKNGKSKAFFDKLINEMIPITNATFLKADYECIIKKVMINMCEEYGDEECISLKKKLRAIEELVYGVSKSSVELILKELSDSNSVLQALVFFLRSPQSSTKLREGLEVYKASPCVCRYSWILFSSLNGLEPIEAEKTGDRQLMNIAETNAMKYYQDKNMIQKVSEESRPEPQYMLAIEENITAEMIRTLLLSEKFKSKIDTVISAFTKNKLLVKKFNEKKYKMVEMPYYNNILSKQMITEEEVDKFIKALQVAKKKSKVYDVAKFKADYIEPIKVFDKLFEKDKKFWEQFYKDRDK